jgi:hypothetical protein
MQMLCNGARADPRGSSRQHASSWAPSGRSLPSIDLMAGQLEGTGGARGDFTPCTGGLALEVVGESFLKKLIQPLSLSRRHRTRLSQ